MTRDIIYALEEGNKWWKGDFDLDYKPRESYEEILQLMQMPQIIALSGLRRVGKTTLMLKIVKDFREKFGSTNIMYFSFDDFSQITVREVMAQYARLLNKDITHGKFLFLFDEIQKIRGWEEQVKRVYDNYKNVKMLISGSESLFIRKRSKESLAGRIFELHMNPLTFKEFLLFKNKLPENIALYHEEILREYHNYLLCNGFPELVHIATEMAKRFIKELVIEKIIFKDIPQTFPVGEPAVLHQLFAIILSSPGEIIDHATLAAELGVSRITISLYLDYLEKAFLIRKLYNYAKNARKTQRKLKKYYPTIISPDLVEKSEAFGRVFEASMVLMLNAEYFWRDTYKNEVDVITIADGNTFPIEIKSSKIDDKAIRLFLKKFGVKKGMIMTYETKDKRVYDGKEIEIVPFYEYFLSTGKNSTKD